MFSSYLALLALALVHVRAAPNPTTPGSGVVVNEGATCTIAWTVDPDSLWKEMSIELMSGSNDAMQHITTVTSATGTIDATTVTTFSYTCPSVTPNSAIYFYQFSDPADPGNLLWTTRFAIATTTGTTTAPANADQPNGDAIPWGIGALTNPSLASPPPNGVSAGGSSSTTSKTKTGTSLTSTSSTVLPGQETTTTAATPVTTTPSSSTRATLLSTTITAAGVGNTEGAAAGSNQTSSVTGSSASGAAPGADVSTRSMAVLLVGAFVGAMLC